MRESTVGSSGKHLIIGPTNSAGQCYQWARSVRSHLRLRATSVGVGGRLTRRTPSGRFQFPADCYLPHHRLSWTGFRQVRIARLLETATHVAVDGFFPLSGRLGSGALNTELRTLYAQGIATSLISHGSDTRDPDTHMAENEFSYFRYSPPEYVNALRESSHRNRQLANDSGLPIFVSTPDLRAYLPQAKWLPLVVDCRQYHRIRPAFSDPVLTILHVPSTRNPPIKGTQFIDPVLRDLERRGAIRYLNPPSIPHREMFDYLERADIVIDQLMSGFYGVMAVESLAAGRLTVGNVSSQVRLSIDRSVPIVDATPESLRLVLEEILTDLEKYSELARTGPEYARKLHDGRSAVKALASFLKST